MSVFLMGVHDPSRRQWCTVAKCGNGHDDATILKLQTELKMKRINKVRSEPTQCTLPHHKHAGCYAGIKWGVGLQLRYNGLRGGESLKMPPRVMSQLNECMGVEGVEKGALGTGLVR